MKKTTLNLSLLFAVIASILALLYPILSDDTPLISWTVVAILVLGSLGLWAVPAFCKSKLLTLVPVLALLTVSDYLQELLDAVMPQGSGTLPAVTGFETLDFMLKIAFVVAMVFLFVKGFQWARITTIVYSSLLLIGKLQLFLSFATAISALPDEAEMLPLTLAVLAFLFAYATQLAMFTGLRPEATVEAVEPAAE